MTTSAIHVYQKNWAFTSADSESPQIKTGSYGPCYVVTFTGGTCAAMAHIDDNTKVESITAIFEKFREHSIELKDVKVLVSGGWREHEESSKWGEKIITILSEQRFQKVVIKHMFAKRAPSLLQLALGLPKEELSQHYFFGALVDARNGTTYRLPRFDTASEERQNKQIDEFLETHDSDLSVELPLTQVFS